MARYTDFNDFVTAATRDGYEIVFLRDTGRWMKATATREFFVAHQRVSRDHAEDLFNLEMRVFGHVKTVRPMTY